MLYVYLFLFMWHNLFSIVQIMQLKSTLVLNYFFVDYYEG